MPVYAAPLDDIGFVLHELIDADALAALPGYEMATPDVVDAVVAEAAKLAEKELFPLNAVGDRAGCRLENGVVYTPPGFREAYAAYAAGGWSGVSVDPAHGGQGLPHLLTFVVEELFGSANMAFAVYPGLVHAAVACLLANADEPLRRLYLPKLADGSWTATMCLSEPASGTDLGLVRSRAVPHGDGTFRLTGHKIYISGGEHDLSENIVHLVLARLPDAPPGTRGISLFLVPKVRPGDDGSVRPGARNGVTCIGIEDKMGMKASATCQLAFDEATGWLLGRPHKGMRAMFVMMNAARLYVGLQGLAQAEVAYQNARLHAGERLQGRALTGPARPDLPADPIVVHPDVRRMLLTQKAFTEGARALLYWVSRHIDVMLRHPDADTRQEADDLLALMTPVAKAYMTDMGFECTNLALQVFGGHGYIRDLGIEQYVRDTRITQIYEGTNGVQALDLVGRKLPQDTGRLLRRFFHPVDAFLREHRDDPALAPFNKPLAQAFRQLQLASGFLAERGLTDPNEAGAAATDYLRLLALVAMGYMWARMARVALARLPDAGSRTPFYQAKLATARFFMTRMLPEAYHRAAAVTAGAEAVMGLQPELL